MELLVYCLRRQRERGEEGGSSEQDKDCSCERERERTRQTKRREENYRFLNVGTERGRINCIIWTVYISQARKGNQRRDFIWVGRILGSIGSISSSWNGGKNKGIEGKSERQAERERE